MVSHRTGQTTTGWGGSSPGPDPGPEFPRPAADSTPDRAVGLVAFQLRPHSRLADQWSIVGNCPKEGGWKQDHEPEHNPDLKAKYPLPDGRTLGCAITVGDMWSRVAAIGWLLMG